MKKIQIVQIVLAFFLTSAANAQTGLDAIYDRISNSAGSNYGTKIDVSNAPLIVQSPGRWPYKYKVIQKINDESAILSVSTREEDTPEWVWYEGPSKGFIDGKTTELPMVKVDGTKTYKTKFGTKTLKVIKPVSEAEFIKMNPEAITLTTKKGASNFVQILSYKSSRIEVLDPKTKAKQVIKVSEFDAESKKKISAWRKSKK